MIYISSLPNLLYRLLPIIEPELSSESEVLV